MNLAIEPIPYSQKSVLQQLFQLYAYDFSEYNGRNLNNCGFYAYAELDSWWLKRERYPYFLRVDEKLAGFALVSRESRVSRDSRVLSEFFVLRKYRRQGVGTEAARRIFDRFPGQWEVSQNVKNPTSLEFWGKVIPHYTEGGFRTQRYEDDGAEYRAFVFDNTDRIPPRHIHLEEVTRNNYWAVCCLEVGADQQSFVAPNAYSLAQSAYDGNEYPFAIYNTEELIGFGMIGTDPKDDSTWILRFMIDRQFQHMGYGREAFRLLLKAARSQSGGAPIFLSAEPDNHVARKLYRSFGFEDTGDQVWGELVMKKEF